MSYIRSAMVKLMGDCDWKNPELRSTVYVWLVVAGICVILAQVAIGGS